MVTKKRSQQSQKPFNYSGSEHGEYCADFLATLQEWDCGERTMVSTTLRNEDEIVDEYAEAEALKVLIEVQLRKCNDDTAALFQAYADKMEGLLGTAVSVGDMVAYDALTVRDT